MILQALCDYYERKEDDLAKIGFEDRLIPFVIVINQQGEFILLEDRRDIFGKKVVAQSFTVPQLPKTRKASVGDVENGVTSGIAWDHFGYILGQPKLDKKTKTYLEKEIKLAESQLKGFKAKIKKVSLELDNDKGIKAVTLFYEKESNFESIKKSELWGELIKKDGTYIAFRMEHNPSLVCQSEKVISYTNDSIKEKSDGFCLVKGKNAEIARTHGAINIPGGTNPKIVSFNKRSFESFSKTQSFNSPVGVKASFEYTTALNYLLRINSQSKFNIGETSYVCWSEKQNLLETVLPFMFSDAGDDPEKGAMAVKSLFSSIHNGAYQAKDGKDQFFVLGLAPNSARIVICYWNVGTIASHSENIAKWFKDLEIIGVDHYGYPPLKKLLRSTALQYKDDNVAPNLPADVIRGILSGGRLPDTFMQSTIRRIKAELGDVTFNRACILKAYLNRKYQLSTTNQRELTVSLNKDEKRIGYCLGRLFAALEKLQLEAQPGIKATIRDRYYSSASSTPKTVFGTLMRLSTHHLKKLEKPGWRINSEKRIGEIMGLITEFPSHLNLENQGLFAIGYYHQKQDFLPKKLIKEKKNELK